MDKSEAFLNGWLAHKKGLKRNFNPYNEDNKAYSNQQWESGWGRRRDAVKHDLPLEYDDAGFADY